MLYACRTPHAVRLGLHLRRMLILSSDEPRLYYITQIHQVVEAFFQRIVHGRAICWREINDPASRVLSEYH